MQKPSGYAGALHNTMVRGIERRKIFRNDADRDMTAKL